MACLFALWATGSAMAASSSNPLNLLDTCLARLHNVEHATHASDKVTLSESCPELSLQLTNPQLEQLDPALEDETTLGQLKDVKRGLLSLQMQAPDGHTPELTNLKQILKKIYKPEKQTEPAENPVDKLLNWIGKKIRGFFQHDNWLTRHFNFDNGVSKNVIKGMFNIFVLLLVVIVLFIVVNEMRAASFFSLFRRRHGRRQRQRVESIPVEGSQRAGMRDISELPLNRQVPALLRYTLQQLMDKHVLPRRYNLTNQEFLGLLRQKLPDASQDFELLVDTGDSVLYGNKAIAAEETSRLFERVRHLEQIQDKGQK